MSWQVRLGDLDEEIEQFLEKHPDFPVRKNKEFVKYAVRQLMIEVETSQEQIQKERERILEELEDSLEEKS